MTPNQVDAIGELFFLLFSLMWIPISWLYAAKRGRRPWLWALLALFISWLAVLLLRLLPDKTKSALPSGRADDGVREAEHIERIMAEQNLRDLLR